MSSIKRIIGLIAALLVAMVMVPSAAHAAGSDGPTPYQVTTEGVQLPAGDTFRENGHVNVEYFDGDGIQQSAGIHFEGKCIDRTDAECAGDPHEHAQFIGESFIPWSAFGITEGRITWVQISHLNEHFGEGGQKPVPVGPKPEPGSETRVVEDTEEREVTKCPSDEVGYGTVTTLLVTVHITQERTSTIEWDGADWVETWGEWTETGREDGHSETVHVREMTDDEYGSCGMPPTGAPLLGALALAGLLTAGGALALRSRRNK